MRAKKIELVVGLFLLFFKRNVLNVGLMNRKAFRLSMIGILCSFIGVLSGLIYHFFDSVNSTYAQTRVVLDSYSCSVFIWTFLAFLFVKVFFIKKGNLIDYTMQMPLSKKEKNVAILIFEIIIAITVVLFLSASMIIALILRDGVTFLFRIICNVLFNCVTCYFLFELGNEVFGFICDFLGLSKIKNVLIICVLSLLLICFYVVIIPDVFLNILYTYNNHSGTAKILFYTVLMEKYGMVIPFLLFLLLICSLGAAIVMIPNLDCEYGKKYIKLGKQSGKSDSLLINSARSFFRKTDTINYLFIVYFVYSVTVLIDVKYGYFSLLIFTINALYAFTQTDELRYIYMQKKYSSLRDYLILLCSQFYYIIVLSFPILIFECIRQGSIIFIFSYLGSVALSVLFFTMAGILFPARDENPFSAMIGLVFILSILCVTFIVCFIMNLSLLMTYMVLLIIGLISGVISVDGLHRIYVKRR